MPMNRGKRTRTRISIHILAFALFTTVLVVMPPASAELPQGQFYTATVDENIYNGQRGGFEPHILAAPGVDGKEWYYYDSPSGLVSPGLGRRIPGNFWISKDYGETWTHIDKGTIPGVGASGDTFTTVSKDGTIFFTDLYGASASVDTSPDGGQTWYANPGASEYMIDDRQWLDIGPTSSGSQQQTVYFSFNQMSGGGLVMVKTDITTDTPVDDYTWVPCNAGLPITTDVGARDNFAVDQKTGNIYLANFAPGAGELDVWVSTNGGNSFTSHKVTEGDSASIHNIFAVIDTDSDGNVYLTWSSRAHVFLAVSKDQAATWSIYQITQTKSVRTFPWVAGGDAGQVGVAWYESQPGDEGRPDDQTKSWWSLKTAICHNALDENPVFNIITVAPNIHYGGIQTTGTGGGSDRDLGDFLTCNVDSHGRLLISYGNDGDDGPNTKLSYPMFARQIDGPFLKNGTGPVIDYRLSLDGRTAHLSLTNVTDLEGLAITNITVDWGDGSEPVTMNSTTSLSHEYPDKDGRYNLTIQATNELDMRTTALKTVKVSAEGGFTIAGMPGGVVIGGLIVLLAIAAVALKMGKKGDRE